MKHLQHLSNKINTLNVNQQHIRFGLFLLGLVTLIIGGAPSAGGGNG